MVMLASYESSQHCGGFVNVKLDISPLGCREAVMNLILGFCRPSAQGLLMATIYKCSVQCASVGLAKV